MRYPPALTFSPGASWVYRLVAWIITIILIALGAYSMPANGLFSLKNSVFLMLAASASLFLLRDAYRRQQGSLHYTQGVWHWQHGEETIAGTCVCHLDLQSYMLVRFCAHPAQNKPFLKTTQWFHLEGRHADYAATPGGWLALRRAIACPMASPFDAWVA